MQLVDEITASFSCNPCADQIDENGIEKKSANERGENGLEKKEQPSFETHTRVGQCQLLLFLPLALSVHLNL